MTAGKTEIKIGTYHEVGAELDDALEGAHAEVHAARGAKGALAAARKQIANLGAAAKAEVEEGELALEEANAVSKYLTRVDAIMESALVTARNQELVSSGKASALEKSVQRIKKKVDTEAARIQAAIDSAGSDEDIDMRPTGARQTIKERRQAEARAEAKAKRGKKAAKKKTAKKAAKKKPAKKKEDRAA
jgi:hypothetical protein